MRWTFISFSFIHWQSISTLTLYCFQGNSPQAKAIARHLSEKLQQLKAKIGEALVDQVAEDFIDITSPLKQLTEAATVPLGKFPHCTLFIVSRFVKIIGIH